MWKNYILALFLGFTLIIVTYFVNLSSDNIAVNVKDVVSNESCTVTEINKEEEKYVVKAYMPVTGVDILDDKVSSIYNKIIEDFIKETESLELLGNDKKFTLTVNFNGYEYNDYLSFLITYSCDFGGAHPDSSIKTVNYNKKSKEFVTIDTLLKNNKNIIEVFSKYSYENLSKKTELLEKEDMLKTGTFAKKDNFESFVFSKEGIILFFPNYSVASYYLGDFEVLIPYDKLGI